MLTFLKYLLLLVLLISASLGVWHRYKPMPDGLAFQSPLRPAAELALLVDDTWVDDNGQRHSRQQIFDEFFRLIGQAKQQIVIDMFLFNDFQGEPPETLRPLSAELTQALLDKRAEYPQMPISVITDGINTLYGGQPSEHLQRLQDNGIQVISTPLSPLRDSNPSWSGFWRLCCQHWRNNPQHGWLPNPLGDGKVTLRSYLTLLNFKANHRKTLLVDEGEQWTAMVLSANSHDGSAAHSNTALRFSGPAALDLLRSEQAVAALAGVSLPQPNMPAVPPAGRNGGVYLQVLSEARIRDALLDAADQARRGDTLLVSAFYFSHRGLVTALKAARQRGATVQVLLDPNKDAFGREKNGVPNRQVGRELAEAGIAVRWCNTQGEQCHSKSLLRYNPRDGELILGSANFTRRNLDNLNLETSVRVVAPRADGNVLDEAIQHFQKRWNNDNGEQHSVDFSAYEDSSRFRVALYRFMEFTGWSSF